MDVPSPEEQNRVEEIVSSPAASVPGAFAAKASIIAAVAAIVVNIAQLSILGGRPGVFRTVEIIAIATVLAGTITACAGFFKGWNCRNSNVIILAAVGLLLNGGMLSTGALRTPIKGRADGVTAHTESAKKGRIVTQDWTSGYVVELTDSTFDNAINDSIVLVDCWAPRCGPCRRMSPIIDELADDYKGKVKVCKLNVDLCRNTAAKLRIRAIPTIILYKNGRIYKTWVGLTDKSAIMLEINKLL
jgi:thioredoxin 1